MLSEVASALVRSGQQKRKRKGRLHRRPESLDLLVMTLLKESNRPLGAYDIAERSHERGTPLSPAQVYRVLDRLGDKVQRIELLAAWLVSQGERRGFLVCRCCRSVESFPVSAVQVSLDRLCRKARFNGSRAIVEALGLCADCAEPAGPCAREYPLDERMNL